MNPKTGSELILNGNRYLSFIHLQTCDSTNDYLKSRRREIEDRFPLLLISDEQTSGRGRGQRRWFSPKGMGLYASLAVNVTSKIHLNLLSFACGIAVLESLKSIGGNGFRLKWPNDIMFRNKKIAGILVENIIQGEKIICICGFGINLNHDKGDFPPGLRDKSISMKTITGDPTHKDNLITILVLNFFKWLNLLETGKTLNILKSIRKSSYFSRGDKISIRGENGKTTGVFLEILRDGGISIKTDRGEIMAFYSGEAHIIDP
jgi:BirA family biotin operon repressor/biotin-[acetyl-CoA-carboxylase] ligase